MVMGLNPQPIIDAVGAEEEVCALQMEMMWAFGLRLNEAIQIQPEVSDKGTYIHVTRGTKGGKSRDVKFSGIPERAAWQRDVLDRAKAWAKKHNPKGILAIPGISLQQMRYRLLYLATKHGVSKGKLGITLHGLRHQFGCDLFKELSGMPAPVRCVSR